MEQQPNEIKVKKPRGNPNIHKANGRKFSSEYQPENRRKPGKPMQKVLERMLSKKTEIVIEGIDPADNKKKKLIVSNPTAEVIIMSLTRAAAKGNMKAIEIILDRVDGKVPQKLQFGDEDNNPLSAAGFVVYSDGRREEI